MDISSVFIVMALALNLGLLILVVLQFRRRQTENVDRFESAIQLFKAELLGKQSASLLNIKDSLDTAHRTLDQRLAQGASSLDKKMAVFAEIQNQLGQLSTQTTSIEAIGKNIQSLSDLLRPPQLRGKLGEMFLENLLAQILPRAMYEMQYSFPGGQRVDAVIHLGNKLLPIDAKFPLESFQRLSEADGDSSAAKEFSRTIKKHVDDIADKYIRPADNTTEFAILYIPAEAVYYRLISQEDDTPFSYALSRQVVPSSPGHLYSFLVSLSAVYSEIQLAQAGLSDGSRSLSIALQELTDTAIRLNKLQERMEGSLRNLSLGLDKSRQELAKVTYNLEKLRELPSSSSKEEKLNLR